MTRLIHKKHRNNLLVALSIALAGGMVFMCALPGKAASTADTFAQNFTQGKFDAAHKLFDKSVAEALSVEKLASLWNSLEEQGGKFKRIQPAHKTENRAVGMMTLVPLEFEHGVLDLRIVTDGSQQISGIWVVPHGDTASDAPAKYKRPDYVDTKLFVEKSSKITGNGPELDALWTLPNGAGPFPALVLVHGSGANDKDETVGSIKPFKDLADGLASRGIAVLRYNKRSEQYPSSIDITKLTVQEETIDDAIAAMKIAASTANIDPHRIFLLGHSLGGRVAPLVVSQYADAAGLVILAGDTRPYEDVINEQIDYLFEGAKDNPHYAKLKDQIAHLKDPALSDKTPASQLPFGIPAGYWLDFRSYDPVSVAQKLSKPMLILQGERDYQVTAKGDFAGWKKGLETNDKCTFKLYPALNHLFVEGTGKSLPQEYEHPGNVSRQVVEDIAQWVKSH
jgi:dienelactone hydrolase